MDNKELPQEIVGKIQKMYGVLPQMTHNDIIRRTAATKGAQIASEYYEPKLAEKDAKIKEQAEQIQQMKVKFNLNYGGGFTDEDIKIASPENQIEKLKGLLKEFVEKQPLIVEDGIQRLTGKWGYFCKRHGIQP